MKVFLSCKKYLKGCWRSYSLYTILSIIASGITLMVPVITGGFIDELIHLRGMRTVYRYTALLAVLTIFSLVLQYINQMIYLRLQTSMGTAYNKDVLFHIQKLPMSFLQGNDMTQINQQVNGDTNDMIIFCLGLAGTFVVNTISLMVMAALCFWLQPQITFGFIICSLVYVLVYFCIRKIKYTVSYTFMEEQNRFFSALFEQLDYVRFIKENGISDFFRQRLTGPFSRLYTACMRNGRYSFLFGGMDSVLGLAIELILYILGAAQILQGNITVGSFIIFSSFFNGALGMIRYFFSFASDYQEILVSYNRIQRILEMKAEPGGTAILPAVDWIEIKNLSFAYGTDPVIDRLSQCFKKGTIYCITGKNGSGKTTLLRILLGLYNDGIGRDSILFNGCLDIQDMDLEELRQNKIAYVEQQPLIMEGSVPENILLGAELTPSKKQILDYLAKALHVHSLLQMQGTVDSSSFSGGEQQKICLIRALVKETPVILLDEPTSAMDSRSAQCLGEYLEKIKKDKIIIIVTHDDNFMGICDEKVVMSE